MHQESEVGLMELEMVVELELPPGSRRPLYFVREGFAGSSTSPTGRRERCTCVYPCTPGAQTKKGGGRVGLRQDLSSRSPAGVNGLTSAKSSRQF